MEKTIAIKLLPSEAADEELIRRTIASASAVPETAVTGFIINKHSIDARGKQVWIHLTLHAYINEPAKSRKLPAFNFPDVHHASHTVVIVGTGPAGLFAALNLVEKGIKPILLERGKDTRSRRRDLAALNKDGDVNPESNYCFGEGGAGTYSDGKLYTRSNKRGDINRILHLFVHFGAEEKILYEAHPHIGTNKLPGIITAMRKRILECGGEIHFQKKLVDFQVRDKSITHAITSDGDKIPVKAMILATGHSARDIFHLLNEKGIQIEQKPFALGVRVEHPQSLIDQAQYHLSGRPAYLPPASYNLVHQVDHKGVFSFCMCPGGIIAPAATAPGEVVVNGWSPSKRNNPFANSGIVVPVEAKDAWQALKHFESLPEGKFIAKGTKSSIAENDPLLLVRLQSQVEKKAFIAGAGKQVAPAQRLEDFINNRVSADLPVCSYLPGIHSASLEEVLPPFIFKRLQVGFREFGKKIKGYRTNEAVIVATESRTSSPVRIPRDPGSLQHPQLNNLFPCGEGAGYAGGIVSAAMDGERVAARIAAIWSSG